MNNELLPGERNTEEDGFARLGCITAYGRMFGTEGVCRLGNGVHDELFPRGRDQY